MMGTSFLPKLRRARTPHGFPSPCEFQLVVFIIVGEADQQLPPFVVVFHMQSALSFFVPFSSFSYPIAKAQVTSFLPAATVGMYQWPV